MARWTKAGMLVLLASCACLMAQAQPRPLQEGLSHAAIEPPLATRSSTDIIEVLDVFWYGCPVCQDFEPMMSYWGRQVRGDLVLRRMPAIWNELMKMHARIYFTAVALDIEAQTHGAVFRHLHDKQLALNTTDQIRDFFGTLGVAATQFDQAWTSPEVAAALDQAERDTVAAGINRVPALVVNGRYRVLRNAQVPELTDMVITANELISLQRKLRRPD